MRRLTKRVVVSLIAAFSLLASTHEWLLASDWPTWRHDAARSGSTDHELPDRLTLQWTRQLPPLEPAWPDQDKLDFDRAYQPIVVGHQLIIGSPREDTVVSYDTRTGERLWKFYAGGPVRFAPAAHGGRLFVACDDGYLYCLGVADGELLWKFRGGPSERRNLGNGRLISTWPVRGAPAVSDDGVVYFGASIWPFMGIFLYALDAASGEVVWTNDGDGSMYIQQPHNTDAFAGVAPQGPMALAGDRLLVPGGRSVPACYDRLSGQFQYYELARNGKRGGGWEVVVAGDVFVNGGYAFDVSNCDGLSSLRGPVASDGQTLWHYSNFDDAYECYDLAAAEIQQKEFTDRKGNKDSRPVWSLPLKWSLEAPGGEALIHAGSRLYASSEEDGLVAVEFGESEPAIAWKQDLDAPAASLVAADDRLFAVSASGILYCFGAADAATGNEDAVVAHTWSPMSLEADDRYKAQAAAILDSADVHGAYALCWGIGDGGLVSELVRQAPSLRVIAFDPDETRVRSLRERLHAAGIEGQRASAYVGDPVELGVAPYMARLLVCATPDQGGPQLAGNDELLAAAYELLRPYGGVAHIAVGGNSESGLSAEAVASLTGAEFETRDDFLRVIRAGAIAGAANWTHEHADAANSRVSQDTVVRAPLGVLWFGDTSHEGVLPRHGHGPQPQVIDGRAIVEGVDMMRAIDIYTGRLLWERELPGVGKFYDFMGHQPGANGTGTNFVSTPRGVYVAYGDRCLRLDLNTGETLQEYVLPAIDGVQPGWSYLNLAGDTMIAAGSPLVVKERTDGLPAPGKNLNLSASKHLFVLDCASGEVLWSAEAENYFRHNAICVGGERLFVVDLLAADDMDRLKRRGEDIDGTSRLVCFDLRSGHEVWSTTDGVFGTWLSYSDAHEVLIESGRPGRDVLADEPNGMRTFKAADGTLIWSHDYAGPPILHGDQILLGGFACDLLTGEKVQRDDPFTGDAVDWRWTRTYGCNTPMASTHLMTFRSGAAGYFDLAGDGGTGNFGGFRSGCSNNLVVAGGVLTAPDYTRTCVCSYQNQTSIALVHMPEAEMWTTFPVEVRPNLRRLHFNLGAPGARRDAAGQLWVPEDERVQIDHDPSLGFYSGHSAKIDGNELSWVAASGCRGIARLEIDPRFEPQLSAPARFQVRLHFCDPDNDEAGARVFNVQVQGKPVLRNFDIVAAAGGRNVLLTHALEAVEVTDSLVVEFVAANDGQRDASRAPLLCGIEIIRQDTTSLGAD